MEINGASTPSTSPQRDLNEVWGMPQKNYSYFNFIVAERKKYSPGSGPPLIPITAALKHDKTGYIIDKVFFKNELRYLVGFKDEHQLRISVRPQNILDWVSEWEAEDWEERDFIQKEKEEEELLLPIILAKEARKQKEIKTESRGGFKVNMTSKKSRSLTTQIPIKKVGMGRGRGRPPLVGRLTTKMSSFSRPGRRTQSLENETISAFTSPRSQRRISTGLAQIVTQIADSDDSESEAESEDTDAAIHAQLNNDHTDLDSESPDPLMNEVAGSAMKSHGTTATLSKGHSSSNFVDRSMVATTSAYEAGQIWDSLMKKAKQKSSVQKPVPSIESTTAKSKPSRKVIQAQSNQQYGNKQTTPHFFADEDALMKRSGEENIETEEDRLGMENTTKEMRFPTRPHNTISSTPNPLQNQGQKSQLQVYKYKSSFDKPIRNNKYRSPYDDPQDHPVASQSSINQTYRNASVAPGLVPSKLKMKSSVSQTVDQDEEMLDVDGDDDDLEYNVERILDVETRVVDGKNARYYLIKWEGDWEDTWEPQENVGDAAIAEFKATKRVIERQNAVRSNSNFVKQNQAPVPAPKHIGREARTDPNPSDNNNLRPVAATVYQNPVQKRQINIPGSNQGSHATPKYNKQEFARPWVWNASAGSSVDIPNKPKCAPCIAYKEELCYGGVPCEPCRERGGFSAMMCASNNNDVDKLHSTISHLNETQRQSEEDSGVKKVASLDMDGISETKHTREPEPVVVISSDEEEEDDSSSESEQSYATGAESTNK